MLTDTAAGFAWELVATYSPFAQDGPMEIGGVLQDMQLVARHQLIDASIRNSGVSGRTGQEYDAFHGPILINSAESRKTPSLHVATTVMHECVAVCVDDGRLVRTDLLANGEKSLMVARYEADNAHSRKAAIPGTVSHEDYLNHRANRPRTLQRIVDLGRKALGFAAREKSNRQGARTAPIKQSNVTLLTAAE